MVPFRLVLVYALFAVGCGGATPSRPRTTPRGKSTVSVPASSRVASRPGGKEETKEGRDDVDHDSDHGNDDYRYGHAASRADVQAIEALMAAYYSAGARKDGRAACRLLYSLFAEEIPELYGEPPGPPSLKGKTCVAVMKKFFEQHAERFARDARTLRVTTVRIKRLRSIVIMSVKGMLRRDILVHREHKAWKVDELIDTELA
jgi:hypothetical protein